MRKHHYFEFVDLKFCPKAFREVMMDTLANITVLGNVFNDIAPLITNVMNKTGTDEILDLCSGGGGPWQTLFNLIIAEKANAKLTLSDLYPNAKCVAEYNSKQGQNISYEPQPINALDVPKSKKGVRTFFGSFHHMSPTNAVAVLSDAANKGTGIVVAESYSNTPAHNWKTLWLFILTSPFYFLFLWLLMGKSIKGTPVQKVIKVLFTYFIPIIPLLMIFDTFISSVRVYLKEDYDQMVAQINVPGYIWETGTLSKNRSHISYVIGYPEKK